MTRGIWPLHGNIIGQFYMNSIFVEFHNFRTQARYSRLLVANLYFAKFAFECFSDVLYISMLCSIS